MDQRSFHRRFASAAVAGLLGAVLATAAQANDLKVTLTGSEEVPPVATQARGMGTITVSDDRTVSGTVTTTGIAATAAHIHQGAKGANGGVLIPLTKNGEAFTVPAGTKLTDAQYDAFKAGNLYLNVHSAAHKDGEIRAQLKP
jgi:hypothetical protein